MPSNNRARVFIIALALACAALLVVVLVTRGSAITTQTAPSAMRVVARGSPAPCGAAGAVVVTLPLRIPVNVSMCEIGGFGGSDACALGLVCCDGQPGCAWSWIGTNGNGTIAQGHNVGASGMVMLDAIAGPKLKIVDCNGRVKCWMDCGGNTSDAVFLFTW